jgi:hypothetical protein
MGSNVPKEFYVVGFEQKDKTLALCAGKTDPERFPDYESALSTAQKLNVDAKPIGTEWKVYRMKVEEAKPEPATDRPGPDAGEPSKEFKPHVD